MCEAPAYTFVLWRRGTRMMRTYVFGCGGSDGLRDCHCELADTLVLFDRINGAESAVERARFGLQALSWRHTASSTEGVRLVMALAKRGGTLRCCRSQSVVFPCDEASAQRSNLLMMS